MIPKIIHYCWLSDDPVPAKLQEYYKTWEEKLPDYEFVKWNFSKFDRELSVWVQEAFDAKKYAFACDFIRLYAIYNYGGIYMDMDVEVVKSFDDLLGEGFFFGCEGGKNSSIEAGCFGAEKGNEFIGLCLEKYKDKHFIKKDGSFDEMMLPLLMTGVYKNSGYNFKLYSSDFFTAKSNLTGEIYPNDNTYTIHHFAGTWISDDQRAMNEYKQQYVKKYGQKFGRVFGVLSYCLKTGGLKKVFRVVHKKILK